jgi:hypothetical protein
MAFMGKDWVGSAPWRRYELRVLKRAGEEINLATFLFCTVLGTITSYGLQYWAGLRGAHDTFLIVGLTLAGALAGILLYFWALLLSAPAKMDAEAKTDLDRAEADVLRLRELKIAKLENPQQKRA